MAMVEPSAVDAAPSKPLRAAERRLALLPRIAAVMGVAPNNRKRLMSEMAAAVIFMVEQLLLLTNGGETML